MNKTQKTFNTLNIVTTAMLCAMCVALSAVFHYAGWGSVGALISPMHFPVLLAGILCGPWLGLICGVVSPLVSFFVSGAVNPRFPDRLIPMIVELAVYGFLSGVLRNVFLKNSKTSKFSLIIALVISMIAGRIPAAFVSAIFMAAGGQAYFAALGVSLLGKFTSTWAGIILQLILIPAILFALQRSGVLLKYLPVSNLDEQPATADNPAENNEQSTDTYAEQQNDQK